MELSNFKVEESKELAFLDTLDINEEIFFNIVKKLVACMRKLGINLNNKSIYYQRNTDKTSILAVKVSQGEDSDVANFMFNGCDAREYARYMSCDVYLHADAKSGQQSMGIANMMSRDIVDFFNTIEGELALKGLSDNELFIRIPLEQYISKENEKKDTKFLRLVNFFRRKK